MEWVWMLFDDMMVVEIVVGRFGSSPGRLVLRIFHYVYNPRTITNNRKAYRSKTLTRDKVLTMLYKQFLLKKGRFPEKGRQKTPDSQTYLAKKAKLFLSSKSVWKILRFAFREHRPLLLNLMFRACCDIIEPTDFLFQLETEITIEGKDYSDYF